MQKKSKNKPQSIQQKPLQAEVEIKKANPLIVPKWAIWAVVAFTAIIYLRALFNDFASWDDDDYIINNAFIRDFSFSGIKAIFTSFYYSNYHPLTTLTYLFEYSLFGLNPLPYHLVNVLLHLLNTWLVYKLVEKLSGKSLTGIVVSLLFAIHPMHVESVAWISERKDVLYSFFYLLSLLAYLKYLGAAKPAKHYIWALVLFLASVLSKPMAVTLPLIMIAIDVYQGRKINKKSLMEKVPFFLVALIFGIISLWTQWETAAINDLSANYSYVDRIFLFTYTLGFYFVKLIAPFWLSVMHYYPDTNGASLSWEYYLSLPLLVVIAWLVIRKHSLRKETVFGFVFFLIAISVILQIVSVGASLASERYTYIPYIGLFFIAGQWLSGIQTIKMRNIALVIFGLFILLFSIITVDRIGVWKNGQTLFTDVIKKNPTNYRGYWTRGNFKRNDADLQGALQDYNRVLQLKPDFVQCLINRGDVKFKLRDVEGALSDMSLAITKDTSNAEAYYNRGLEFYSIGMVKDAFIDYSKAIHFNPQLAQAYNNRGVIFQDAGDSIAAMDDFNKAISINPKFVEAYNNRAMLKDLQGDRKGAIDDFTYSIELFADDSRVYYSRGISRFNYGNPTGACEDWKMAEKLGHKEAGELVKKYCK